MKNVLIAYLQIVLSLSFLWHIITSLLTSNNRDYQKELVFKSFVLIVILQVVGELVTSLLPYH